MVLGILLLFVTLLCALAVFRELKNKNLFAVAFAGISTLAFGFFSIATIIAELTPPAV